MTGCSLTLPSFADVLSEMIEDRFRRATLHLSDKFVEVVIFVKYDEDKLILHFGKVSSSANFIMMCKSTVAEDNSRITVGVFKFKFKFKY